MTPSFMFRRFRKRSDLNFSDRQGIEKHCSLWVLGSIHYYYICYQMVGFDRAERKGVRAGAGVRGVRGLGAMRAK